MKKFIALIYIALASVALSPAAASEKFTVMLEWYVNPDHGPMVVAAQRGYFAEAGLDVELIAPGNPNDPPKLVAAKQVDVAVFYQPQLHLLVDKELPVARIGTLVATPLNSIVVLKDAGIDEIKDLSGKKVGYSVAGFEDVLLAAVLERNGLTLEDVELINVNFSLSPSVMSGQVDAVIGAYRNFELHQMDIHGKPGRAFFLEEAGVPAYDELIYVAHLESLADPALRKFIDATERATQFIINHPDEAWQDFVSYDASLNDELNRRAWRDTVPRFALRPGALDHARYEKFAQFLRLRGLIERTPPIGEYAVELSPVQ